MAIRVNLDMMLLKRGMTLSALAEAVDVTLANLSILKTNKARAIRFSTLEAICRELDCQPGDLLRYLPDENDEKGQEHTNEGSRTSQENS
jgi:putative transcriptional regulator